MEFQTKILHVNTKTGDKLLYPFGPSSFQTYVDEKFVNHLLKEGEKLTKKNNNANKDLAGNSTKGGSYNYPANVRAKFENT